MTPDAFYRLLGTVWLLLQKIHTGGLLAIEGDIEEVGVAPLYTSNFVFDARNTPAYVFVSDTLRLMLDGTADPGEVALYSAAYRESTAASTPELPDLLRVAHLALYAFARGLPPRTCVEFGRQGIPPKIKPSYAELDAFIRSLRIKPEIDFANIEAALDAFYESLDSPQQRSETVAVLQ